MKQSQWISAAAGALALTTAAVSSAAVPLENRLPYDTDSGAPAVTFTDVAIEYKPGKTNKRKGDSDTQFFAESTSTSSFSILDPNGDHTYFTDGFMALDAQISPKGTLKQGGYFGVWSGDSMFDDGSAPVGFDCNKQGNGCQGSGWLVYGGDLKSFGWDGNAQLLNDYVGNFWGNDLYGLLEFGLTNQSGWAWDQWGSGVDERVIFGILGGFDLNDANAVTSFSATAKGMAIVPVPAAVWLFGSGLLGLVGIARRKRV
ncbi:MAG: VPLPA-CTERM sorting domain-containing protein [Thiogranum sp.]|nr:VPLPA-CTERM sorting domain-containing protein [Thiogranum sp.]